MLHLDLLQKDRECIFASLNLNKDVKKHLTQFVFSIFQDEKSY